MGDDLRGLLDEFEGISLEALDERAALLRRVDSKYVVPRDTFAELLGRLRGDHRVLEIDGRRAFSYSTTYFDTRQLRCFVDHVEDRVPRFKARSRLYENSGRCVFEVKLKRSEDETDKRQIDYDSAVRHRVTDSAMECVRSALDDAGLAAPDSLEPTLTTSFDRLTFAARQGSQRMTCDLGVTLRGPHGQAEMPEDLVLVETKSERGDSPADRELARLSIAPTSLSKYRVGMSLVGAARHFGRQPGAQLFRCGA